MTFSVHIQNFRLGIWANFFDLDGGNALMKASPPVQNPEGTRQDDEHDNWRATDFCDSSDF